jgi:urease accessory protein
MAITIITSTIMTEALRRSSPRQRGPRLTISRSRGDERTKCHDAALTNDALYRLLLWLSPAYPVGAFAYSSGIEWAVETGNINNVATLRDWLDGMLTMGSGVNDAIFFAQMHRAMTEGDDARAVHVAELAAAFAPSRERYEETTKLGRAFVDVTEAACAGHAVPLAPALHAFLTAIVANWISAGVRLIPLGHTDSQRLLQMLEPLVRQTAERALISGLDDLGSAVFGADLAGIRHETQYTRLFRS